MGPIVSMMMNGKLGIDRKKDRPVDRALIANITILELDYASSHDEIVREHHTGEGRHYVFD